MVDLSPKGQAVGPPTDRFRDVAFDGQYQRIEEQHIFSVQGTYIREHQTLDASVAGDAAENPTNDLRTGRLGGSYYYHRKYGGGLGLFSTTGTSDGLLYPAATLSGFAAGSPNSRGWTGELDYVPWQNVKLLMQYVHYSKFNGAGVNYDGSGRNANDNNTVYVLCWVAF